MTYKSLTVGELKDILKKRIDYLEDQIKFFAGDDEYHVRKRQALTTELEYIREEVFPKFLGER